MSFDPEQLDDATALRVLRALARVQSRGETPDAAQLAQALPPLDSGTASDSPVSEGDLARATLAWLAQDPQQAQTIEALVAGPAPTRFFGFEPSMGTLLCVLLLLKTKAVVERDKEGRWRFKVELVELKQGPLSAVLGLWAKLAKKV